MKKVRFESGRSMVEMIGVLAVMGLITAAAFVFIQSNMASSKRSRASDEVGAIVTAVREQNSGEQKNLGYYVGWSAKDDSNGTTYLRRLRISTKNPWGGDYSVRGSDNKNFFVVIKGLASGDCDALKTKAWSGAVVTPTCETQNGKKNLLIKYSF